MGLTNTAHKDIVQSITNMQADLLKNPFYLFNDKRATIVDYYNLNTTRSTMDQALQIPYANLGCQCPLRFNKIIDFYIYGIERIALNLEMGEFGLESSEVSGESYILPDTITPYPGDYFLIKNIKNKYLFWVTAVTPDTFDNGANYWRISYKLNEISDDNLKNLVVEEFQFSTGNVGTNFASVIKKTSWDLATRLDNVSVMLKQYYKSLFYNEKVQTFTFVHMYQLCRHNTSTAYFYDPYLIEFIINNKILENSGEKKFLYVNHKTYLKAAFPIRYSKTIWRMFETKDIANLGICKYRSQADYISDPATIFQTRYEDYFEMNYLDDPIYYNNSLPVEVLPATVVNHIELNQLFDYEDENFDKFNLLIKYMNGEDITYDDIKPYERINDDDLNETNFFLIPLAIFCIESYVRNMLAKT